MTPLDLFFFSSSKVFENSAKSSKFKLFTGGRFKFTVEIPVLSLTSTRTSSFDCVDWSRTALSEKFLVIGAKRLSEFMMRIFYVWTLIVGNKCKYNQTSNVDDHREIKKFEKIRYKITQKFWNLIFENTLKNILKIQNLKKYVKKFKMLFFR